MRWFLYWNILTHSRSLIFRADFGEKSKIKKLIKNIPKEFRTVLVFKPKNIHEIKDFTEKINTNLYQIHGNFSINELDKIPKNLKKKIIVGLKLSHSNKNSVISLINQFQDGFFAFLIDNSEGHGKGLDFEITREILKCRGKSKIILAGGIGVENVENIIKNLDPYGIDASSSLENEKGVKDPSKVRHYLKKITQIKQEIIM